MSGGRTVLPKEEPAPEVAPPVQPTAQQIAEIRQRQARGRTGRNKLVVDPALGITPDGGGTGLSIY